MSLDSILGLIQTALELGLISSLTVLALFLSYSMLGVCDLSTDGCFTLGATVGAAIAIAGHPYLSIPAAMLAGMLSGLVTAVLQTKMGVNSLLSGIIVNTALYSVNIAVMGGSSVLNMNKTPSVFSDMKDLLAGSSLSGEYKLAVAVIAVVVITVSACVFAISKPLSAFQLGEAYAKSVGVNVARFRVVLVLLASMLSACVTAFAGPVSFVGIAVPHLVKSALKSSKPIRVIPACFLGGAIFCAGCDLIARTLFSPVELSISAVTAIFGAPVVIALMLKKRVR